MSLDHFACSVLAIPLAACAADASSARPTATRERQATVQLADAGPNDWVVPDNGQWTTPVCAEGCDPNCVHEGRFQVAEGIVYDTEGDLFWERASGPQLVFSDAATYCTRLSLGGADSGWRLPTFVELSSILFKPGGLQASTIGYCTPAIDQGAFPATSSDDHWMSNDGATRPEAINFFDGREQSLYSDTAATVLCTHDPVVQN